MTPLLRELILRALSSECRKYDEDQRDRFFRFLLDEAQHLPEEGEISVTLPRDARLERACVAILANPGQEFSVAALTKIAGASARTLTRLANDELGCPLSVWRHQVGIMTAIPMLMAGLSVMQTALSLGYETSSGFSAMFKRVLGKTPRAFQ